LFKISDGVCGTRSWAEQQPKSSSKRCSVNRRFVRTFGQQSGFAADTNGTNGQLLVERPFGWTSTVDVVEMHEGFIVFVVTSFVVVLRSSG
jgi:hypothetical protein